MTEKNQGYPKNQGGLPENAGKDISIPPDPILESSPASLVETSHLEKAPADGDPGKPDITQFQTVSDVDFRSIYMNWRFVVVFISLSLGFYASFLGTINSWNGAQVEILIDLVTNSAEALIAPLNLTGISAAVNMTRVAPALNLTTIAAGVNMTQIDDSINLRDIIQGLVKDNATELVSGLNITEILKSFNYIDIAHGINSAELLSGLNLQELMTSLNLTTFTSEALPEISYGIGQLKQGLWIYPNLIFAQIISSLFFGRLSDYVGRRWIFLFGNLVSFVSFLATSRVEQGATIAGLSALIGIGTGIQILGPWLALAELVPVCHRFTVTGLCMALFAPFLALHVVIFQAFLEKTSDGWHWSYYVNAIMSFLSFVGLFIAYHPPTYHQLHNHPTEKPSVKNWSGLIFLTASISLLSYSLGWGKLIWNWDSPQIIAVLTISGVALVGFLIWEYNRGNDHAAYPSYLIRNHIHVSQMILSSVMSMILLFGPIVQLLCFALLTPRLGIKGAWENLWGSGFVIGIISASIVLIRPKHLKWHVVFGMTFGMVSPACLRALLNSYQYQRSMAFCFLMGFGHGYTTVVTYVTAPMTANKRDMGLVVGLVSAFRSLVFSAIRAIFLTLYINQLEGNVKRILIPEFSNPDLPEGLQSLLDGIAVAQSTGNLDSLLDVPFTQTMINILLEICLKSWHFIICIAYIYFFCLLFYSIASPETDSYLSSSVFVQLNHGGILRLPTQSHRPTTTKSG